ncbi:MAG: DUF368 domain-containing protein [Anaerolineae bacterium]|jgi:putative membrane protein
MHYVILALKGVAYGVTHVVPGIGGGLVLIVMGIYEQFVEAVGNFFLDRQGLGRRLAFLAPLGIGMVFGILLSAKVLAGFLERYPAETNVFLMGLLLGTVPSVFRLHGDMRPKPGRIVATAVAIALVVALNLLEGRIASGSRMTIDDLSRLPGAAYNLLISFLGGGASVTPGLDGSMVLILGGTYEPVLQSVSELMHLVIHWLPLVTTAVGVLLGIVLFSKSIDALIKRSPGTAYYGVLGLILGSVYALVPQQAPVAPWWVLVLLLAAGIALAYLGGRGEPEQA